MSRLRLPGRSNRTAIGFLIIAALLAGCSRSVTPDRRVDPKYGTSPSPRLVTDGERVPRGGGTYKLGRPYQIAGRWYVPAEDPHYDKSGVASWYGSDFHGRKTANGEVYDMNAFSAAHPTLPLPSLVYVTNLANGRTVLVRVNDRGPYAKDRLIDLSRETARALGIEKNGVGHVRVTFAGRAPLNGDDSAERRFLAEQPWVRGGMADAPSRVRNRMALGAAE